MATSPIRITFGDPLMTDKKRDNNGKQTTSPAKSGPQDKPDTTLAAAPGTPPAGAGATTGGAPKPDPNAPRSAGGAGGTPRSPGATPAPPSGGGKGLAGLALLIAVVAAAGSGYLWWAWEQSRARSPDPEAQLAQVDQRVQQALDKAAQEREAALQALKDQVQSALAQSETVQGAAQNLGGELQGLKNASEALRGDTQTIRTRLQELGGELESIKADIQSRTETLQGELQTVKSQSETLKGDADTVRSRIQSLSDELAKLGQEMDNLEGLIKGLDENQVEQISRLANRLDNLQLGQSGLLNNLEAVKEVAARGGDVNALPLSEVEYLLRVADHKLKLQKDVTTALDALRIADRRLEAVAEPEFNRVQRMIKENIATLRGVDLPDISALAHKIFEMEQRVDGLPLRIDVKVTDLKEQVRPKIQEEGVVSLEGETPWWEQVGNTVWRQFKDIVTIRYERTGGPPLIAVEEEYFLRQNLRLELEAMRLALLRGDAGSYQESNDTARNWLHTYFDDTNEKVQTFLSELQDLQTVQMNPYVPDITGTLNAFRDVMETRQPVRSVLPSAQSAATPTPAGTPAAEPSEPSEPSEPPAAEPAEPPATDAPAKEAAAKEAQQ